MITKLKNMNNSSRSSVFSRSLIGRFVDHASSFATRSTGWIDKFRLIDSRLDNVTF